MYVRQRCAVPSGATPYPEGWAARETARTIQPLSTALARANRAMWELIGRPDMEVRGFTRGSPRGVALERVAGIPLVRTLAPAGQAVLCQPERVGETARIPPPPISTALPAVTLDAMNFCDELRRGVIREHQLTAEKLRECAAAGYRGVGPSPGAVRMAAVASGAKRYPVMARASVAASTAASHQGVGDLAPLAGELASRTAWGMLAAGLFLIAAWPKRR